MQRPSYKGHPHLTSLWFCKGLNSIFVPVRREIILKRPKHRVSKILGFDLMIKRMKSVGGLYVKVFLILHLQWLRGYYQQHNKYII